MSQLYAGDWENQENQALESQRMIDFLASEFEDNQACELACEVLNGKSNADVWKLVGPVLAQEMRELATRWAIAQR